MREGLWFILLACVPFLLILGTMELVRRIRAWRCQEHVETERPGVGVIEGAVFALLGLMLGFSFSGAYSRFDARRQLIVDEVNDIGTAYLRIDLLLPEDQPRLREGFRQYVDARLAAYRAMPDVVAARAELDRSMGIQGQIWSAAVPACARSTCPQVFTLVLPSLNTMFDIGNTQKMITLLHPPQIVFWLMGSLVLVCSVFVGFRMGVGKRRSWFHILAYAALLTIFVYTIVDLEFPRLGMLQMKEFDQALIDLRNSM